MFVLGRSPIASATLPDYHSPDIEHPSPTRGSKACFQRSLSGLYAIPSYRAPTLAQPHRDFNSLYTAAAQAQQELEALIHRVSLTTQTRPVIPGMKSIERARYKIDTELNGQPDQLTDLARGSVVARDIGSIVQTFELFNQEAEIVEVKNRFKQPASSGYRDLKLLIRLPESQLIAEVQLHLEAISAIKNGPEHGIYETIQGIERQAEQAQRALTPLERRQLTDLRRQAQTLYQTAWHQYLQPERSAA
ncbi:phosphoribosylglycinamide formyltransferase [Photobacterium sp. MCCC 1A19761]|uniref:phosphoribosylglycinamide formyltransferase n=1 Tax=Photobacterium sp. MCCC 1A19761 TaxID=3115000 RepID=UPI00307F1518